MKTQNSLSLQTVRNWSIDAILFSSAIVASLSGIYFLYFFSGRYQGGRNATYGLSFLFPRQTWDMIHTWSGVAMIAIVMVHLVVHWDWVVMMTRRLINEMFGKNRIKNLNRRAWMNIWLNIGIGLSFLVTALSGVYFLFFPAGSYGVPDPNLVFSRQVWDVIHLWSGVMIIIFAAFHFIIHWKWAVKVTQKIGSGFTIKRKESGQCASPETASSVI